jgi:hypothetical protein
LDKNRIMKKLLAAVLIVAALCIGYIGANKVSDSTKGINFLGIKIEASDESAKTQGFVYLGVAVALFAGGVYLFGAAKK